MLTVDFSPCNQCGLLPTNGNISETKEVWTAQQNEDWSHLGKLWMPSRFLLLHTMISRLNAEMNNTIHEIECGKILIFIYWDLWCPDFRKQNWVVMCNNTMIALISIIIDGFMKKTRCSQYPEIYMWCKGIFCSVQHQILRNNAQISWKMK